MSTPTKKASPSKGSPKKGSPVKLRAYERLQQQIDTGRINDEPYVTPTRAVDVDLRLPEERAALNLWADEFHATGRQAYFARARLVG
jgi:hypothetical protein